jgi:hypothetical protein
MDPALAEAWKHSLGGTASHLMRSASAPADVNITVPQTPAGSAPVPPAWSAPTPAAPRSTPNTWYRNTIFIQFSVCVAVFLACFVLLVAIRPPFMYAKSKNKLEVEEFVPLRAFYIALAGAVASALAMVALALMSRYKVAGL